MTDKPHTDKQGDFVWYELMTTDADAAQAFYGALLGWEFADSGTDGMDYRLGRKAGTEVVGLMALTGEMQAGGARPAWLGYVAVDDIQASLAALEAAGGSRWMDAQHMPGVGHMAMVADPQGATFYLMQPEGEGPATSFAKYQPKEGHCAWNEYAAGDVAGAHAFYTGLFGWEKAESMDMGELGQYTMYRHGDYMVGAIYPLMPADPAAHWLFYFRVADIDAAAAQVGTLGGKLVIEPQEIPGGEYSLAAADPQGAMFGLVGPRNGEG
ncbi:VOC family protein [Leptolyngbya sp. 15MV]|nr:VOC family protein [Leptolyngbya sp. 15MV]